MNQETSLNRLPLSPARLHSLQVMANRLRRHSLESTSRARSGHPSTCFSCAELVTTLFFEFLRYDLQHPESVLNDRFVLSKGHAAPLLWAILAESGAFPVERLATLREFDSDLEGHPTPRSPFVDVATGSLGQGLSNAVGMAFASRLDQLQNRIYVLVGDGESAEGAVWEGAALASHYKLDNLTAILDINRLGQSDPTMYQHQVETYANRFEAFGWESRIVDGHDISEISEALQDLIDSPGRPGVLIARTVKGKGVSFMEDREGWHGKPVTDPEQLKQALKELGQDQKLTEQLRLARPSPAPLPRQEARREMPLPEWSATEKVATRMAYGIALRKLGGAHPGLVVLDADTKNSTYSNQFQQAFPERFLECYIAEQNMVGAAAGIGALGKVVFASSFACFLSRAFDFIRMAGISQVDMTLCGSHAGVSIGEDGPSQMALEDLAMMRSIAGSTVLYPSDAVSAERAVSLAAAQPGITYIRTTRPKTSILYPNEEVFQIGKSKVLRSSKEDRATIVAAGITLHEALKAADQLEQEGLLVRVIDLFSVKPIDRATLEEAARDTRKIITVEDHYPEGGLGEAVASALGNSECKIVQLAVSGLPRSGPPDRLMDEFGISARHIVAAVKG